MSAPGAGKTTLLERVVADLPGVRVGVLEGDVQGSMDADRLARLHVPVTQLNTDPGLRRRVPPRREHGALGAAALPLDEIDLLVIENVGNLVCPAEFKVGEDARVMVSSVTEGEDKPLKYPLMFRTCDLVLVNKIDLLPHLDFDLDRFLYNLDQVHPDVPRMLVSARTGEGIDALARLARGGDSPRPSACVTARIGGTAGGAPRRAERGARRRQPRVLRRRGGDASRGSATRWPSGSHAAAG